MVDRDKIEGLVRHLRQYLKHLRELGMRSHVEETAKKMESAGVLSSE